MSRTLNVSGRDARGLSLVELMIAIAIGMVVVAALLALYLNVTRTNNEMAKMNRQIENGRFAIQLLQDDVVHAGFWGTYVPQFDDLTTVSAPLDAPNALPDPCLAYTAANWTGTYLSNLIGIPVQGDVGTCAAAGGPVSNRQANTDALVVRHAMNCVAGSGGNCEGDTAGKLYFQSSVCEKEWWALAQAATANTITLDAGASSTDDFYKGVQIRIIYGTGATSPQQSRTITAYNGSTKVATVDSAWAITPDNSSVYAFGLGYVLGTDGFIFHKRDCATVSDKRKFVSNVYYIRNYATTPGDGIPTLMQSTFDLSGGVLKQLDAQPLIEGIEGFRVMYGIDRQSKGGTPEDYTKPVAWVNPYNKVTPTNRGDGVAEGAYVNAAAVTCTGVNTCPAANVVAVRIYVLARSNETTPGYKDTKTYQLGDLAMGPFNDGYKRHVYSTTVRLVNPSGRRDTP